MKKLLPFLAALILLVGCSATQKQSDAHLDPGIEPYPTIQPRDLPIVGAGGTFRLHADKTAKSPIIGNDIIFIEDSAASWATKYVTASNMANYVLNQINTEAAFESRLFTLPEGGTGSVAGTDTQVQFNDDGDAGGDAGFTYNKTTNELTITGGISTPSVTTSATDGAYYGDFYNTVPITATPTLGRFSGYGSRLHWADGTDWDDYFLLASDIGGLVQGYDADLANVAGAGAADAGTCFGKDSGGVVGFWTPSGGGSGSIEMLTSDPASPATNYVWYNSTDKTLNVREAGGSTKFTGVYTADSAPSGPEFESLAVGVDTSSTATTIATATNVTIASGDNIVVFVAGFTDETTTDITGVVCGSNTLTLGKALNHSGFLVEGWTKPNASAHTGTCTATFAAAAAYRHIVAAAYSGIVTSSALDKSTCNYGDCVTRSSASTDRTAYPTATTAQADELLVAFDLSWDAPHAYTAQDGYTRRTAASGVQFGLFDKVVSATGAYPTGNYATVDSADSYLSLFLTFKAL